MGVFICIFRHHQIIDAPFHIVIRVFVLAIVICLFYLVGDNSQELAVAYLLIAVGHVAYLKGKHVFTFRHERRFFSECRWFHFARQLMTAVDLQCKKRK